MFWSGGVTQADYWGNHYFDDTYYGNGRPEKFHGYCTDVFAGEAVKFVEANRSRPFFLYLPTNAAHEPYLVDKKYSQPYEEKGVSPVMSAFYGMITNIDENAGRFLARLREPGLAENTIFIYMNDNGTAAGFGARYESEKWKGFNAGMRGGKGTPYDGGHRAACFMRWPAGGFETRDIPRLAAHIDILPTLIDLAGLKSAQERTLRRHQLAAPADGHRSVPARPHALHPARPGSCKRQVPDGQSETVDRFRGTHRCDQPLEDRPAPHRTRLGP